MHPSRCHYSTPEPLEHRIAPATIIVGNPNLTTDTEYSDAPFVATSGENVTDPIALAVGGSGVGEPGTFLLKLSAGDSVIRFTSTGNTEFIRVIKGSAVAFFVDYNEDNEVQPEELTGLALSKGADVSVKGTVFGDVVTMLDANFSIDLAEGQTGLGSNEHKIARLAIEDVVGGIYAGGSITNVSAGNVGRLVSGTAANGFTFDFFPDVAGGAGTIAFAADANVAGPNISKVIAKSIGDRIEAGSGGASAKGGSISNVQITADSTGLVIQAGNGGNAVAGGKTSGGAGGTLSRIFVGGFDDDTPNSPGGTQLLAGSGGDALTGSTGKGGAGGSITNAFIGFNLQGNKIVLSPNVSQDAVSVVAGDGGDGRDGGAGGKITKAQVRVAPLASAPEPPDGGGPLGGAADDQILIAAGNGGGAATGGKAGNGGAVVNSDIRNLNANVDAAAIVVLGGDGGAASEGARGGNGGSVTNPIILGQVATVEAGDGSNGTAGGNGGSVKGPGGGGSFIVVTESILIRDLTVNAGFGGSGTTQNGGSGGAISNIRASTADFTNFTINGGDSANGGSSISGKGGKGGNVTNVNVIEAPAISVTEGALSFRSGIGGNGGLGGGNGGNFTSVLFSAANVTVEVIAGGGGDASVNGNGGKGGSLKVVQFGSLGEVDGDPNFGDLQAGDGGDAAGPDRKGGAGGSIATASLNVSGDVSVVAGNGGNGTTGASGKGGSLSKVGAFSGDGAGILRAGDAGTNGGKGAAGGSITSGTVIRTLDGLTITAGNGAQGGAGGNLSQVNFSSSAASLFPAPGGDIIVRAGDGSGGANTAGKGGSISNVIGFASSSLDGLTSFIAGVGGSSTKGAPGGSITNLSILGGGAELSDPGDPVNAFMIVQAGDAGDGTLAPNGAKGGSIRTIAIQEIANGTVLRSIAAGDGGNGINRGGDGGTIDNAAVLGTSIGNRFGGVFGYDTMGGLFAGLGGNGATPGTNGSVLNIRADGIAAIVAGRGAAPDYANRVERITVSTTETRPLRVEFGDINLTDGGDSAFGAVVPGRYAIASMIGFFYDSTRVDANQFAFTDVDTSGTFNRGDIPLDGLVMARTIRLNTFTITPEAYATPTLVGGLFDYDNRLS
jgi:hypothetical protein